MKNLQTHIDLSLKQNRNSQKALFEHYSPMLYRWAIKYMLRHHDTEEVVQNAWISIFKGLENYKHNEKFEAWIKMIVVREAWKARARQVNVELLSNHENKLGYDIEKKIYDDMSCSEILDKLEQIPFGSREVFKMYVLDGYKHSEIAKILSISQSTSRVHLTKARSILKKLYFKLNLH